MEEKTVQHKQQNITIENRKKGMVTGVSKVVSSCETALDLVTAEGGLSITGTELKINKYDIDSGVLVFEGTVNKLQYTAAKTSLLKKMFK